MLAQTEVDKTCKKINDLVVKHTDTSQPFTYYMSVSNEPLPAENIYITSLDPWVTIKEVYELEAELEKLSEKIKCVIRAEVMPF